MAGFNYNLIAALPVNQVFVKAEDFMDTVKDTLDEALSEEYICFYEDGDLTEDDDIEIYNIYKSLGIEFIMKYITVDMEQLTAYVDDGGKIIRYVIPVWFDIDRLMED